MKEKLSKVTILLRSRGKFDFLIKSEDKEKVLSRLIKQGDFHIFDYDFAVFDSTKGRAVVNISQIDAFTIEDLEEEN